MADQAKPDFNKLVENVSTCIHGLPMSITIKGQLFVASEGCSQCKERLSLLETNFGKSFVGSNINEVKAFFANDIKENQ